MKNHNLPTGYFKMILSLFNELSYLKYPSLINLITINFCLLAFNFELYDVKTYQALVNSIELID